MNIETNSYSSRSNAARALRKIVKDSDDLLEQLEDGRWTFSVEDAKAIAAIVNDDTHSPDVGVNTTAKETTMSTEDNEGKTTLTLAEALAEEAKLNQADEAAGKTAPKKGESDEEKAEKERLRKEKAEQKAKEKAEAVELRKQKQAEKAAAKEAEKLAAKAERQQRSAGKNAEKEAAKLERANKAAAKDAEKAEKLAKKEADRQAKIDAEAARKADREAARAARASSVKNGIRQPGPNSKLGKLWQLIEGLQSATGAFPTFQAYKEAASTMSYEDAGGPATITTAYYDYRMYHGVTGRIVEPKAEAAAVEAGEGQQGEGAQAE